MSPTSSEKRRAKKKERKLMNQVCREELLAERTRLTADRAGLLEKYGKKMTKGRIYGSVVDLDEKSFVRVLEKK